MPRRTDERQRQIRLLGRDARAASVLLYVTNVIPPHAVNLPFLFKLVSMSFC